MAVKPASARPVIVWLRDDLRLADHPALAAAVESDAPVVVAYVLDDETPGEWKLGGAARWWLHMSLASLDAELRRLDGALTLRHGAVERAVVDLARASNAAAVHVTRRHGPDAAALDDRVRKALEPMGCGFRRFAGSVLFEPEAVPGGKGDGYKVFTPFWRACLQLPEPRTPLVVPNRIAFAPLPPSDRLSDWGLLPTKPDWAGGLRESWRPGGADAEARLAEFVDGLIADYPERRDKPGAAGTSRLSPHLRFGEISPRQVWHAVKAATHAAGGRHESAADAYLRQLGWREFSWHLLFRHPETVEAPLRPEFRAFPWRNDAAALLAWQRGRTGYPVVDAGMRELWQTGWMHNRVRMVAASFLVKHLLVSWQDGAAWFWDTLVDADLANNSASWQWVAGSGADAAPFFRIFNPVLQGEKFDPAGAYVRRWVPELARLPDKHLHQPWSAPDAVLAAAGVRIGETYPAPIVEHGFARKRALDAFRAISNA
jgi:deoxyribodipyrimidine photo-lyase